MKVTIWILFISMFCLFFDAEVQAQQLSLDIAKVKRDFERCTLNPQRSNIIAKTTKAAQKEKFVEMLIHKLPANLERPIEDIIPTRDKARDLQFTDLLSIQELIDLASQPIIKHD